MVLWSTLALLLLGFIKIFLIATLFLSINSIIKSRFQVDGTLSYSERIILGIGRGFYLEVIVSTILISLFIFTQSPSIEHISNYSFIYSFVLLFILVKNPYEVLYWAFIFVSTIFLMEYTSIANLHENITFIGATKKELLPEMILYKIICFILMSIMVVNRAQEFINRVGLLRLVSLCLFFSVYMTIFFSFFTTPKFNISDQVIEIVYSDLTNFVPFILKSIALVFVISLFAQIRKKPHRIAFEL